MTNDVDFEVLTIDTKRSLTDHYADFAWIKVKRYIDDPSRSIEQRYSDLVSHHMKETGFLIAEVRKLAGQIDRLNGPPRTMAEVMKDATERMRAMTPDEFRASLVRAGIIGEDGRLASEYRNEDEEQ